MGVQKSDIRPQDKVAVLSGGGDASEIPEMSLPEFLLTRLRAGLDTWGHKPFMVDVVTGSQIKFCDVESQSRRVASALSRRGFKQGHVLYYVTYEMTHLYVFKLAVWMLGGTVRGCYQTESPERFASQMRETSCRFVLVDAETAPKLREATASLEWPVTMLSIGDVTVSGSTALAELLQDDGTAFPEEEIKVNPREDVVEIPNTSGSTGVPKGVLHTHFTTIAGITNGGTELPTTSVLEAMTSSGIGTYTICLHALCKGLTIYHVRKFQKEQYFDLVMKHKPRHLIMYPYLLTWFARCGLELARVREAGFLESIWVGGWVLDHTTVQLIARELPSTFLRQMYGMTEVMFLTLTEKVKETPGSIAMVEHQGQRSVSSGKLMPFTEVKVVDLESGAAVLRGDVGEIQVRSPCVMRGYLRPGGQPNRADFDQDNWFRTGDIGFVDDEGNLYVKERKTFMFRYYMKNVSPCEIEAVLQEHEAVLGAGVVGVPHPETDNLARAFVVLRPECHATADELQNYVAQRLPVHKHLHGGVRFVKSLALSKGDKLDRAVLKRLALEELTSTVETAEE